MKKKGIFSLLVVPVLAISLSPLASAYSTTGYKFPDATFYYNGDQLSKYGTAVSSARTAWTNAYSKIKFSYNGSSSELDFFDGDYGNTGANAVTTVYPSGSPGYASYGKISFNDYYMKNYSPSKNQGVAGHELGHVFGLDHVYVKNQIMCTDADGRTVNVPGSDDIAGAKALY